MYKCHNCRKQFVGGLRIYPLKFWQEYLYNKQIYKEIAVRYGVSESTVKRKIRLICEEWHPSIPKRIGYLLLDTTYFGRNWRVLVAMDVQSSKIFYRFLK